MTSLSITPLGDTALTIRFGDGIDPALNDRVARTARSISTARLQGVTDVVPSYASLSVHYDPVTIGFRDLRSRLFPLVDSWSGDESRATEAQLRVIGVRYDGEDLEAVAGLLSLSVDDVIRIHAAREYRVFVIGFVPGFAYLGPLDSRLVLPRRESPRKRVPAGAVAIAEAQTGIYPSSTPGGWHLIGSTSERMFDAQSSSPALLTVGDRVKFEPIA